MIWAVLWVLSREKEEAKPILAWRKVITIEIVKTGKTQSIM
jgi:hypothetical protein